MAKRIGLRGRIEQLERRLISRPLPRIILALFDEDLDKVIGYAGNNVEVLRGDETAADCAERAFALTGAVNIVALYGPQGYQSATEREGGSPISIV